MDGGQVFFVDFRQVPGNLVAAERIGAAGAAGAASVASAVSAAGTVA